MRKFLIVLFAVFLCVSCTGLRNVRITDYRIAEMEVSGLSSLSAALAVSVDNPGKAFVLEEFGGMIRRRGEDFASFSLTSPVSVAARSSSECRVEGRAVLSGNVSPLSLFSLAGVSAEDFTVDATISIKPAGGIRKKLRLRDVPLEQCLRVMGKLK